MPTHKKPIEKTRSARPSQQHTSRGGLWTSRQLARFLRCTERHLFNLRQRGLPAYRIGSIVRFDIEQVKRWLESNRENTAETLSAST